MQGDFYSDMRGLQKASDRQSDSADISDNVVDFCKERNIKVPPAAPSQAPPYPPACAKAPQIDKSSLCDPRQKDMDATTFKDLFLRVHCLPYSKAVLQTVSCKCQAVMLQCKSCVVIAMYCILSCFTSLYSQANLGEVFAMHCILSCFSKAILQSV